MKILSIDTASNVCGVSILEDSNLICNLDQNTGRTHSENLMPMIKEAFDKANLTLANIDLIVCDKGPGSFTGIRIGVSTAKAFTDSKNIPAIGVSSLEALAYNVKNPENSTDNNSSSTDANPSYICSIMDCKNENCYFALYKNKSDILETLIEPQAESIEEALAILKSYFEDSLEQGASSPLTFIGDGSEIFKDKIKATFSNSNFANENQNELNSYSLGIAGLNIYNANSSKIADLEAEELLPLYLKKPQAQRQLEEKLRKEF